MRGTALSNAFRIRKAITQLYTEKAGYWHRLVDVSASGFEECNCVFIQILRVLLQNAKDKSALNIILKSASHILEKVKFPLPTVLASQIINKQFAHTMSKKQGK